MHEWLIGQFESHFTLLRSSGRKCCLKVICPFVMGYCDKSSKVLSLEEYCLHCTGPVRQFKTNFGLERARITKRQACQLANDMFLAAKLLLSVSDKQVII